MAVRAAGAGAGLGRWLRSAPQAGPWHPTAACTAGHALRLRTSGEAAVLPVRCAELLRAALPQVASIDELQEQLEEAHEVRHGGEMDEVAALALTHDTSLTLTVTVSSHLGTCVHSSRHHVIPHTRTDGGGV